MNGPGGRPQRGRRDNGLNAGVFVAVADVDPRIGEHLLDVLGIVGIAAYLTPSADLNPVVRATTLPSRPTDRLWVDRERIDEARGLLEAVEEDDAAGQGGAGQSASANGSAGRPADAFDLDSEWDRIVAGFHTTAQRPGRAVDLEARSDAGRPDGVEPARAAAGNGQAGDPAADAEAAGLADPATVGSTDTSHTADETADNAVPGNGDGGAPTGGAAADDPSDAEPRTGRRPRRSSPDSAHPVGDAAVPAPPSAVVDTSAGHGGPAADRAEVPAAAPAAAGEPTDDEGYSPPPPPPLPRLSGQVAVALLAIAAGLVLFFRPGTLGLDPDLAMVLGLFGILGGAGALVHRLKDGWNDDDPDDGAVV